MEENKKIGPKRIEIIIEEKEDGKITSKASFENITTKDLAQLAPMAMGTIFDAALKPDTTDATIRMISAHGGVTAAEMVISKRFEEGKGKEALDARL